MVYFTTANFEFFQMYVSLRFTRDTYIWINLAWLLPTESFMKYILVNIHHNVIIHVNAILHVHTHTHTHTLPICI